MSPRVTQEDRERMVTFTAARAFNAEGMRVAIVTCHECGAALLIDPADAIGVQDIHRWWHERLALATVRAEEREACALLLDDMLPTKWESTPSLLTRAAAAIRARGGKENG